MAISQYPRSPFGIGQTVTTTNGTFTIDCSSATDFYLDFNSSYYTDGRVTPTFVGYKSATYASVSTATRTLLFDTFSGGSRSSLQENDVVVFVMASGAVLDDNLVVTSAGWTELTDLYISDTYDTNLAVFYKVMGATPDTSIDFTFNGAVEDAGAVIAYVWSKIDPTNPIDVTITTATSANGSNANPPSITTATDNAVVLAIGAAASVTSTGFTQGGDLSNFVSLFEVDNYDVTLGIGSIQTTTAATVDPAAFTANTASTTSDSWAAATVALRAAKPSAAIIDFTNIPNQIKEISVFGNLSGTAPNDISLTWDTDIVNIASSFISVLKKGSNFSNNFFCYSSTIYGYDKPKQQKIQKTKYILSTQSWTAPVDVSEVDILICGGGGGGDNISTYTFGGGGSVDVATLQVVPGTSYTITIGAGGAAGAAGSSSSFGSLFTLSGGSSNRTPAGKGGAGGGSDPTNPQSGINGFGDGGNGSGGSGSDEPPSANTGKGGGVRAAGGSGICIIKYWSAY